MTLPPAFGPTDPRPGRRTRGGGRATASRALGFRCGPAGRGSGWHGQEPPDRRGRENGAPPDFPVGIGAAEPSESVAELAPLLRALFDGSEPLLDRAGLGSLHAAPEQRYWRLQELQSLLERAATSTPAAHIPGRFAVGRQRHGGRVAGAATSVWARCRSAGFWRCARIRARDSSGASSSISPARVQKDSCSSRSAKPPWHRWCRTYCRPSPMRRSSAWRAKRAATRSCSSSCSRVCDKRTSSESDCGRAILTEYRLPERVRASMRERLARMSDSPRHLATVAGSLGRTFSVSELSEMLGRPPGSLLTPVEELIEAGIVGERGDELGFQHDLIREAVRGACAPSARRALDRQAADVMLRRGALPVEVAIQLAASAAPGDEVAITTLLAAGGGFGDDRAGSECRPEPAGAGAGTREASSARSARRASRDVAPRGRTDRGGGRRSPTTRCGRCFRQRRRRRCVSASPVCGWSRPT